MVSGSLLMTVTMIHIDNDEDEDFDSLRRAFGIDVSVVNSCRYFESAMCPTTACCLYATYDKNMKTTFRLSDASGMILLAYKWFYVVVQKWLME